MSEERLKILKMVETGEIDAEQAAILLVNLETPEPSVPEPQRFEQPRAAWARFWIYPLMAGGAILLVGALIMGLVYATGAARGWQLCGWPLLFLGLIVILLALWSRSARWLHIRISEGGDQTMTFGFPLPLTLAAWVLKIAQPFVPQLRETGVDDLLIALRDGATGDEPFFIDVQDDEKGERVQLYLG